MTALDLIIVALYFAVVVAGQEAPGQDRIKDAVTPLPAKGQTGGAFGKEGVANRRPPAAG